jgi:pullulanase/glycogen debranching enzyme
MTCSALDAPGRSAGVAACVAQLGDVIDIWSSHDYSKPDYASWLQTFEAYTAITSKSDAAGRRPFWADEGGLNGEALRMRDEHGQPVRDDSFLLLFNAHVDAVTFTLPGTPWGERWTTVFDTALDQPFAPEQAPLECGGQRELTGLSLQLLKRT